jgi:hypothetical protein
MEHIDIGPAPYDEECAAVGQENFAARNAAECRALAHQIARQLGEPPEGAYLRIKANPHDFGSYHELVCKYEDDNEDATNYAYRCESECPAQWDDEARAELAAAGFPAKVHA